MKKRNKFERVQLPRNFGLNTENSVLIGGNFALLNHHFIKERNKFSVRTFYHDDRSDFGINKTAPHFCMITKSMLMKKAPECFKQGLHLIVADQIHSKDCKFCGTIWISNLIIVELAYGPGTVRRVTNEGKVDDRYNLDIKESTGNLELDHCITRCKKTGLRNVIFDFSYYNIPIGCKNENFICWEITDDGTHKNLLFKE